MTSYLLINGCFVVFTEETSGSEEENMHYYSPAADLGFRSRKKKKPKAHSKNSQSLFSVILSVNHGLMCLHTNAKVTFSIFHTQALLWLAAQIYLTSEFYFINNIHHWFKSGQSPHSSFKSSVAANQPAIVSFTKDSMDRLLLWWSSISAATWPDLNSPLLHL